MQQEIQRRRMPGAATSAAIRTALAAPRLPERDAERRSLRHQRAPLRLLPMAVRSGPDAK
jgi:hypothetical protein